jgi:gamma-glutamylputrescine oxidase
MAAQRGLDVIVLEAARVGAGSSGRTGGVVLEETAAGPLEGVTACIPSLERIVRELGIECDLQVGGCWELVHRTERKSGEPGWVDGGKHLWVEEVVPGGTLDPGRLLGGLARAVIEAGGSVVEGSTVQAITAGPPTKLVLSEGSLDAQHVVLALNAFTRGLVPEIEEIHPALTLALCTEPLDLERLSAIGLGQGTPFYTADLPYLWGRPLPDGRVIFGGGLSTQSSPACGSPRVGEARLRSPGTDDRSSLRWRVHRMCLSRARTPGTASRSVCASVSLPRTGLPGRVSSPPGPSRFSPR